MLYRLLAIVTLLTLAACASEGPQKRATENVGPIDVRARNSLAAENPAGLVRVGEGFERAGNFGGAYTLYQQALAAAPDLLDAKIAIARVMGRLGQADASKAQLADLVIQYPASVAARTTLIDVLVNKGDYIEAQSYLDPMLEAGSADVSTQVLAGRLAAVLGDMGIARNYFDAALKINEYNPDALRFFALSFALDQKFETAVALLQKAMDRPEGQNPAKRSLALIYALSGQTSAALSIARTAMAPDEAERLKFFYALLPKLSIKEQVEALMFDRIPKDVLARTKGP